MGGNQSAEADDADDRIRLDRILDPACCVISRANMPARPAPTWLQPKRPWTVTKKKDLEGFKGGRRDGDEESATSGANLKRSPRTHARTQDANLRSIIVNNYLVAPREAAAAPGAGNPATSLFCPETFSGCESTDPEKLKLFFEAKAHYDSVNAKRAQNQAEAEKCGIKTCNKKKSAVLS